jgi:hypothetical protein
MILQAIVYNWIAHVSKSWHPGSDEYLVDLNLLRTFWDPISKYLYPRDGKSFSSLGPKGYLRNTQARWLAVSYVEITGR